MDVKQMYSTNDDKQYYPIVDYGGKDWTATQFEHNNQDFEGLPKVFELPKTLSTSIIYNRISRPSLKISNYIKFTLKTI